MLWKLDIQIISKRPGVQKNHLDENWGSSLVYYLRYFHNSTVFICDLYRVELTQGNIRPKLFFVSCFTHHILTPSDLFLWGKVKENVFSVPV